MTNEGIWTLSRLARVSIDNDCTYGVEAVDAYNPFELYRACEEARGSRLPPHLVFANLRQRRRVITVMSAGKRVHQTQLKLGSETCDRQATALFLTTYGWLTDADAGQRPERIPQNGCLELDASAVGEGLWEKILSGNRPMQPAEYTRTSEQWRLAKLGEFWQAQEEFALAQQLLVLLQKGDEEQVREVFTSAVCYPVGVIDKHTRRRKWPVLSTIGECFGVDRLSPEFSGLAYSAEVQKRLLGGIQATQPETLMNKAEDVVGKTLRRRLKHVRPTLEMGEPRRISCTWDCENLLEALYVMLFLDVEHRRRTLRCEGCGILFYETKANVNYCGDRCANRVRVRRAQAKQRKKANRRGRGSKK